MQIGRTCSTSWAEWNLGLSCSVTVRSIHANGSRSRFERDTQKSKLFSHSRVKVSRFENASGNPEAGCLSSFLKGSRAMTRAIMECRFKDAFQGRMMRMSILHSAIDCHRGVGRNS